MTVNSIRVITSWLGYKYCRKEDPEPTFLRTLTASLSAGGLGRKLGTILEDKWWGSVVRSSWLGSSLEVMRGGGCLLWGGLPWRTWGRCFTRTWFFFAFKLGKSPGLRWILGSPARTAPPPSLLCLSLSAVQPKKPRTPSNTQCVTQWARLGADKLNNNFSLDTLTKSARQGR